MCYDMRSLTKSDGFATHQKLGASFWFRIFFFFLQGGDGVIIHRAHSKQGDWTI